MQQDFIGYVKSHRLDRCPAGACDCSGTNVDPAKGGDWWATCADSGKPPCWYTNDGWDAMEGSISGTGCRPSINAIAFGEAAAMAELATLVATGPATALPHNRNGTLVISKAEATAIAAKFTKVAAEIRSLFLELLWNNKTSHFAVYKSNTTSHGSSSFMGVSQNRPLQEVIHAAGISIDSSTKSFHPPTDPRATKWTCGSPFLSYWGYKDIHELGNCSSNHWPCDALVDVKELFALSCPWYFGVVPHTETPEFEAGWRLVRDGQAGYGAKWGLRTATLDAKAACTSWDRGNGSSWNPGTPVTDLMCPCYNSTHGECSWDGPSWPYESARVLSALANLLQPGEQCAFSRLPCNNASC